MKKIFLIIILLFAIISIVFFIFKSIKIKTITCESQYGQCSRSIKSEITNLKKTGIFETRGNLNNLLKKDNSILSFTINFQLPNSFKVNVIERKAIIAFALKSGAFDLVDSDGLILSEVNSTNLPKITTSIALDHDEIVYLANLMNRLYLFYKVSGGKVTSDGFYVSNISGKAVIFPLTGDKDILIGSLILIISRLPSVKEATTMGTIDLRFKNPVLKQ